MTVPRPLLPTSVSPPSPEALPSVAEARRRATTVLVERAAQVAEAFNAGVAVEVVESLCERLAEAAGDWMAIRREERLVLCPDGLALDLGGDMDSDLDTDPDPMMIAGG